MNGGKPNPGKELGWIGPQRRALVFLLSLLLAFLAIQTFRNRTYVPNPQPPEGSRAGELASRIDPNAADWQTLAAIPTVGEKRAKAIVAYRERARAGRPDAVVFRNASDLTLVRGIGGATAENLGPYLFFPGDPATASASQAGQ